MTFTKHIILGAGGAISRALVPELAAKGEKVVLVSRSGHEQQGSTAARADLSDCDQLAGVVPEGSAVYLLAGLPYDVRVWRDMWPRIMDNAIRVCREKQSLLIFFDNVYMYGRVDGPMTEATPNHPVSKKGEVRAKIAEHFMEECASGRINGIIARSADFYGPGGAQTAVPNLLVVQKLIEGKRPQWLARADRPHSLTYTLDCGRALPLLAADESSYNQVWHLPTAHPPITMQRFAEIAAAAVGVAASPKASVLSRPMLALAGLFDRTIKELGEMLYQNEMDYVFDSSKFEKHFSFTPTPYEDGIAATVAAYRERG
ncbi:MAG TPA: NAD-dependent epimerase/dehydratase family protein [Spirochaetia bacterium]|nr:NAD-dependent epimerase/dehydratase family protein [Spirochaetia bacterium]